MNPLKLGTNLFNNPGERSHAPVLRDSLLVRRGIAIEAVEYALMSKGAEAMHIPSLSQHVELSRPATQPEVIASKLVEQAKIIEFPTLVQPETEADAVALAREAVKGAITEDQQAA